MAQSSEKQEIIYHINGDASVTNNGFSFVPTFSLGKPALITNLSVGGERFSFDPQVRFDLFAFKPWSIIIRWGLKLVDTEHTQVKLGAHTPGLSFRSETLEQDGITKEKLVPYRFLSPEFWYTYNLSKKVGFGLYYLYGYGMEKADQNKHTHFVSLRAYFNRIPIAKEISVSWIPQVYYLYIDGIDGFYSAQSISLHHQKIPVSLATMMNIKIASDIESKDFDWNISLIYAFSNQLTKR